MSSIIKLSEVLEESNRDKVYIKYENNELYINGKLYTGGIVYIDDIDKDKFSNLQTIYFKECHFKKIHFESFEDGRQNIFISFDSDVDSDFTFETKSEIKSLKYPKLCFQECEFDNFQIENAKEGNFDISKPLLHNAFNQKDFFYELEFNSCTFNNAVEFSRVNLVEKISFTGDSNFNGICKFVSVDSKKEIMFNGSTFEKGFDVNSGIIVAADSNPTINKLTLKDCEISNNVSFFNVNIKRIELKNTHFLKQDDNKKWKEISLSVISQDFFIDNCEFEEKVRFSGKFERLSLDKCSFEKDVKFDGEHNQGVVLYRIKQCEAMNFNGIFKGSILMRKSPIKNQEESKKEIFAPKVNFNGEFQFLLLPDIFNQEVSFNGKFHKTIELTGTDFKNGVQFNKAKFFAPQNFHLQTFLNNKKIIFNEVTFDETTFEKEIFIEKEVNFKKCTFQKDIDFSEFTFGKETIQGEKEQQFAFKDCLFAQRVDFKKVAFCKNITFDNSTFKENIYFNNSIFTKKADFHECDFQQTACFYGVSFKQAPNFSQARFEKGVNLTNVNLIFEIDKIKSVIEKQAQKEAKGIEKSRGDNGQIDDKEREELLNNTLIKVSNDFRDSYRNFKSGLIQGNNNLDASNFHRVELYCKEIELDSKNPTILSRDWIDKWQLRFYRYTSDHHTDLLRIFNSTIMLIGFFAWLMLLTKIIDFLLPNTITLLENIKGYNIVFYFSSFVSFMCICFLMFIMYHFKSSVCKLLNNNVCLYFAYFGVILLLFTNPQYIFGVANLFSSNSHTSPTQNIVMSIYSILAILFIFSLQKTARKNSIVPN